MDNRGSTVVVRLIGVHEMHGQMHPNQRLTAILLAHDPLSSLANPVISYVPFLQLAICLQKFWLLSNGQQIIIMCRYVGRI